MPATTAERWSYIQRTGKSLSERLIGRGRGRGYLLPGVRGESVEGEWERLLPSPVRVMVIRYLTPEWN